MHANKYSRIANVNTNINSRLPISGCMVKYVNKEAKKLIWLLVFEIIIC